MRTEKALRTVPCDLGADGAEAVNCFTLAAGRLASATGRVLVAQNEDDGGAVVVRHGVVPAADWPEGSVVPHEEGLAAVPQAAHTARFFWREVRAQARGLSNADSFYNEHGVLLVSNSCTAGRVPPEDASCVRDGGVAYVLRRAVAERARSARDAVNVLRELADRWGYAPSGRSYLVADSREVFMLQFARGHQYIGARLPDDMVAVMPNHFVFHGLNDWPEMFASAEVVSFARERGWYTPAVPGDDSDFDFARAYQTPDTYMQPYNVLRGRWAIRRLTGSPWADGGRGMPFAVRPRAPLTPETAREILMSHYEGAPEDAARFGPGRAPHDTEVRRICTSTTQESLIADLRGDPERTVFWLAPGRPCVLPCFRLHPLRGVPREMDPMPDPAAALAAHLEPDATAVAGTGRFFRTARTWQAAAEARWERVHADIRRWTDGLFARSLAEEDADDPEADEREAERTLAEMEARLPALLNARVASAEGLAEPAADGLVRVRFACAGEPDEGSLLFGAAGRSARLTHARAVAGSLARPDGLWEAAFPREALAETLPELPGTELFALAGLAGGEPFGAVAAVAFAAGAR